MTAETGFAVHSSSEDAMMVEKIAPVGRGEIIQIFFSHCNQ